MYNVNMLKKFTTKDSGKRIKFESGFNRDTNENKPRYDLIPTELLTRLADLYTRGAEKYGVDNWKKASSEEEFKRFKESSFRHLIQWLEGNEDEDHAIATVWNIMSYEWHKNHKNGRRKISGSKEEIKK